MDRFNEIDDFIDRAKKETVRQAEKNDVEQYLIRKRVNDYHRFTSKTKSITKKYEKSEKGRLMRKRRASLKNVGEIKDFYHNRPEGYHVDHIIPLALGGKHDIENLQYLSPLENQRRSKNKITTNDKIALIRNRFIRKL
jgi:5-methylcytosine-specific restriction endonuclease McrA